jgi:putative transposase
MPRQPRVEFEGAMYHVLNRGNYRSSIFSVEKSGELFEEVLFSSCGRFGWILYAYVILSNHYHVILKTPEANLVSGMQWLQSTFANRFNRLVRDRGHVFQGRYKALLIENGGYMLQAANYVHLNPVRARLVELEQLRKYELSSFPKFFRRKRDACLHNEDWLSLAGNLRPTISGMNCYHKYLALCNENNPLKRKRLHLDLCQGWYIGTRTGQKGIMKDVSEGRLDCLGLGRFGKEGGDVLLSVGLSCLGKTEGDIKADRKGERWKIVLGSWIKSQCGVSNQWISDHLNMGNMFNVSRMLSKELRQPNRRCKIWKNLKSAKYKA